MYCPPFIAELLRVQGKQAQPHTTENMEPIDLKTNGCHVTIRTYIRHALLPIKNYTPQYLLASICVMLKILRLSFAARIELENNRRLALVKTKTTTEAHEA